MKDNGTVCSDCGAFVTTTICLRRINKSVCESCAGKDIYRRFKSRSTIRYIPRDSFELLPPLPGLCQECAVKHEANLPHDRNSLYYQTKFSREHGRQPTWDDAMAHCTEEMKMSWKETMKRVRTSTGQLLE